MSSTIEPTEGQAITRIEALRLRQDALKLPPFALAHARGLLRDLLALQHALQADQSLGGQHGPAQTIVGKGTVSGGDPVGDDVANRVGINADFILSMGVGAQAQKVEQVVQVHLPVPLSIDVRGQVHAGKLAGKALLWGAVRTFFGDHFRIVIIGLRGVPLEDVQHPRGFIGCQAGAPTLIVDGALRRQLGRIRHVEFTIKNRIPRRIFVHIRSPLIMYNKSLNKA